MTKKEVYVHVAAVLTALLEAGGSAPASVVYLAMGMDMARYETIRDLMVSAKYIVATTEQLTLTEDGRATAIRLNEALAAS